MWITIDKLQKQREKNVERVAKKERQVHREVSKTFIKTS